MGNQGMKKGQVWALMMLLTAVWGVGGCASSYAVPGGGADMRLFSGEGSEELGVAAEEVLRKGGDRQIERIFTRQPLAQLPVHLAVARVQESGYKSYTTRGYGSGNYSVVTMRDIERDEDLRGWKNCRK